MLDVRVAFLVLGATGAAAAQDCEPGKILASDAQATDLFGTDVAISGSLALIGAPETDHGGASGAGSVYVYRREGAGWKEFMRVDHPGPVNSARFGKHVGFDGSHAVIGAPDENFTGSKSGAAYLLTLPQASVVQLVPSSSFKDDYFGDAVDIDGDVAVVGAYGSDLAINYGGAAFVFERDPISGAWNETAVLIAPDPQAVAQLGRAVAVAGDRIAVGAVRADNDVGAVYVWQRIAQTWTFEEKVVPGGGSNGDDFGRAVELEGDRMFIASTHRWVGNGYGMVFGYEKELAGWVHYHTMIAPAGQVSEEFGLRMDLEGDWLVITDPMEVGLGFWAGAATVYRRQGAGWILEGWARAPVPEDNDRFGSGVAVTPDGALLVGDQADDDFGSASGAVYAMADVHQAPVEHLCFCPAGPCNNDADDAGCRNGLQRGARLIACGWPSVSQDDMVLRVVEARNNQLGLIFMGGGVDTPTQLGNGLLCITAPHYRFPAKLADPVGTFSEGPGLVGYSQANFHPQGHITVGSTWYFQGWYRDPSGLCGWPYNTSNALAITFTP